MKAVESKNAASTTRQANTPFFSKESDQHFFGSAQNEKPFFTGSERPASSVQAKLNISQPNDNYEKEADTMADHVVQRFAEPAASQTRSFSPATIMPFIQQKCVECKQEEKLQKKEDENADEKIKLQRKPIFESRTEFADDHKTVQRKPVSCEQNRKLSKKENENGNGNNTGNVLPVHLKSNNLSTDNSGGTFVESTIHSSKGSGRSLGHGVRTQMESSFNTDFSNVRIHDDRTAVQMSKHLNAQAFTHGNDIYFNSGKFDTDSTSGRHLLAHELTHTIQQGGVQTKKIQPVKVSSTDKTNIHPEQINHLKQPVPKTAAAEIRAVNSHITQNTNPPVIQQKEEEKDGLVVSTMKDAVWGLIKTASPELHDIFRYKGFLNWAKEKVSGFISDTINTFTAPIKLGADIIKQVKSNFAEFKIWMASAVERLKHGDCTPFIEATDFIKNILEGIAGPALEKLKAFLAPIKAFIDKLWNDVGKPIWDFITKIFGWYWDKIKWVADKIWTHIKNVINVYAKIWHWFAKAIGFEGDDKDSLWEQIKKKVLDIWEAIKKKLEPYKTHLMILGGIILLLSPAGPFILAAAAFTGIMYAASKIRHYLQEKEAIINERGFIKGVLIPEFFSAMKSVKDFLKTKAASVTGALKSAVSTLHGVSKDLGETALAALNGVIDWLSQKFDDMEEWAEMQLTKLINNLEDIFARIVKFLQPVTDILEKVGEAIADYYKLPFLVLHTLFYKIPKCIRDKIIAFLTKYVFKHIPILKEIKDVEAAWTKMEKKVLEIIDLLFVHGQLLKALWEIFNILLDALKFPKELAVKVYNKAFDVFDSIIEKPKVFFINMLSTVKLGLTGFFDRKWTHLKNGFNSWLFGAVSEAGSGVYIPTAFNFSEIFKMLGSLFSIGMEKVYKSIAKKRGQETADNVRKWVDRISKGAAMAWKWLKALHENSLDDTIEMIHDKGAELLDIAIDAIIDWIVTKIIEKVSAKIISMLDPTGIMAVVNSLIAFYNAVETAIEKAREILEFVDGVLDNISEVMSGALENGARKLEENLEKAIPLFLEFLANQLLSGKLGKKIKEMAKKAEDWIDEKIDWLVDKALSAGDWLVATGKEAISKIKGWLGISRDFTIENGETHKIFFEGSEDMPILMVASNKKKGIEDLIKDRKSAIPAPTTLEAGFLATALTKKASLDIFINNHKKNKNETNTLKPEIEKRLDDIKQDLINGKAILASPDLPLSNVTYAMEGGKAKTVEARPLTKLPGNTKGSRPTGIDSIPLGWQHLRNLAGSVKIKNWRKVHLLSDQLHGPGEEGWNLVPGPEQLNTDLKNGAEDWAKTAVGNNEIIHYKAEVTSRYPGNNNPEISDYFPSSITVTYGYMPEDPKSKTVHDETKNYPQNLPPPTDNSSGLPNINTMSRDTIREFFPGVSNVDLIFSTRNSLPNKAYRDLSHMYLRLKDAYGKSDDFEKIYWPIISNKYNFENAFIF